MVLFERLGLDYTQRIINSGDPLSFGCDNKLVCVWPSSNNQGVSINIEMYRRKRRFLFRVIDWDSRETFKYSISLSKAPQFRGCISQAILGALDATDKEFQHLIYKSKDKLTFGMDGDQIECIPFLDDGSVKWEIVLS